MLIPQNEQGVILEFGILCANQENIKVLQIQAAFPDASISISGVVYRVEFEFRASNFISHQHDVRKCDVIICWENDIADVDFPLPIIELLEPDFNIKLADDKDKEIYYWKKNAASARKRIKILEELLRKQDDDESFAIDQSVELDELALRIFELYTAKPQPSKSHIATLVGVSRPTVNDRLKRLKLAGKLPVNEK